MPQSATCQRCNLKAIYHELGGVRAWTCPRCMTQHPYVSSKKKKDSFRFVMFSFIAGLVFLTLGNLDKTPFSHVPEDPDEARRRLRAEHIAAIMKATQEIEKNPNKRKRTNLAQNAKLYDQIHGENEQLVAEFNAEAEIKNAQDPNFEIPNRREFWKLLGAFTATVDGEVELFVFGLGPNSHLGQVHELESKSVKKIFWPAVASVKSLTMYTQRKPPQHFRKKSKHSSPQSLHFFQNIS